MVEHPYFGSVIQSGSNSVHTINLKVEESQLLADITELAAHIGKGRAASLLSFGVNRAIQSANIEPIVISTFGEQVLAHYNLIIGYVSLRQDVFENGPVDFQSESLNDTHYKLFPVNLPKNTLDDKAGARFECILAIEYTQAEVLDEKQLRLISMLCRDVANQLALRKKQASLSENEELLNLALKNNEDWIFVKDTDFRIVYANEAFLNVYPPEMRDSVIGFTTIEEYSPEEAEKFLYHDKLAFDEGISETIEDMHMPDGRSIIVNSVKRKFQDASGDDFILCVCRDITDKEMLIRELKTAYDDLDEFTNIASHDLKAPINAIRRLLEWVVEDCFDILPEESKENINLVVSRADRMHQLLDDLMVYTKVGRESVEPENIELSAMIDDLKQLVDVPDNTVITANSMLLRVPTVPFSTVMLNLISNAIRHNDKEKIIIDVKASETKHDYIVKVSDNGPGIEPKYFDKIFAVFQTLKARDTTEGSGIGLSVVAKYTKIFGGRVNVDSDGINGSTFIIEWPKTSLKPQLK